VPRPAHQLVTFSGTLGPAAAPIEQWSFGVRFASNRFNTASDAVVGALAAAWGAAGSMQTIHNNTVNLTKVRVAQVDATGHVEQGTSGAFNQRDWVGVSPGGATGSTVYPPQCAVVASLISARAGATGKGRIFLPVTVKPLVATDLRMSITDAQSIADATKVFLNLLVAVDPSSPVQTKGPVVASSKGYLSPVLSVRVGRTIDTMRSRRRDIPEGYLSATL
jgi:hypothetical protein